MVATLRGHRSTEAFAGNSLVEAEGLEPPSADYLSLRFLWQKVSSWLSQLAQMNLRFSSLLS